MEYRQFAKPAAVLVLGAGAAAWAIVNSGGSGDAAPEQSFIPDTARNAGVLGHPRISGRALINPAQGSASKFDNIKAEYMTASCVSCHVNRGHDFTPPALRTKDGDPGPAYYLGGEKGTVFNATSKAFEQESPAITEAGLTNRFKAGEIIFEGNFVPVKRNRFGGLGPTYIKSSCLACHPGYGRGQRTGNFDRQYGNGYLAFVHNPDGTRRLGKFTWDCSRATLENGPGANALWNVTNVTRKNRPNIYMTPEWLEKQKELGIDVSDLEGPQEEELSMQQYEDFMVWHRGLAVPAARNLDKPDVRRGQELFNKLGCAGCHKPEWTTGEYKPLPGYANQTIRPYTDMLRHDMGEINRGRSRFWRTPPLWGRGLMHKTANHTDMFHDLRARDFEEAILWHFGESEFSREMFRHLSAKERGQLIQFLKAL